VPVTPGNLDRIVADADDLGRCAAFQRHSDSDLLAAQLVAGSAGAGEAEEGEGIAAVVAVVPEDAELAGGVLADVLGMVVHTTMIHG
jgi:hypothetical protein